MKVYRGLILLNSCHIDKTNDMAKKLYRENGLDKRVKSDLQP